jgi:tetratricopeptide (TPR) repeat protein
MDRLVAKHTKRLSSQEFAGTSEADLILVEQRLVDLLYKVDREQLLSAAFTSRAAFQNLLTSRVRMADFGSDQQRSMVSLLGEIQEMILDLAQSRDIVASASTDSLRLVYDLLRARSTDSGENSGIQDAVQRELRSRQIISGARPRLANSFLDRPEMQKLREALVSHGIESVAALQGAAGVGKTQLAAAFAQECEAANWRFVGWVSAYNRKQVVSGLANMAWAHSLSFESDPELAATALVSWLSDAGPDDRLLVFDNVENVDDLDDLIPRGQGMHVLVTTRTPTSTLGTRIRLDAYSEDAAIDYLVKVTGSDDRQGARELAAELDGHPLALSMAAATMARRALDFDAYLDLLDKEVSTPSASWPDRPTLATVGSVFEVAYKSMIQELDASSPPISHAARKVLGGMSLLAESGVARTWLNCLGETEGSAAEALNRLIHRALLSDLDDGRVQIHPLIGRLIRDNRELWPPVDRVESAAMVLTKAMPGAQEEYPELRRGISALGAQLAAIDKQEQSIGVANHPSTLLVVRRLADLANRSGDPYTTIDLAHFIERSEAVLGPDHAGTLESRSYLANAYRSVGNLGRAIPLYRQSLADRERVLGVDHPDTLASKDNLANAYRWAGDLESALQLLEQTLTDRERVLGTDHPDTLTSRNNLAYVYESRGELSRAIPLLQQTLVDRERVLGPDHPDTLTSRNNLAYAYDWAGDLHRAIPLLEETLWDRERILGPDHPDTLTSRNNLASAYESAGDLGSAIPLLERTLLDRERLLGPDYPDTLASRNNLASAYESAGDLGRAIPLLEQTLVDRERVLGSDHPDTLASRNNLATAYESAGDLSRAIPLLEQTLVDRERLLGPDHPDTLASRNNLAVSYQSAGDLDRAIALFQLGLADIDRVLGPDHPAALRARNNLASAYVSSGNLDRAASLYEQTLASTERELGPSHPITLTTRANLAELMGVRGNPSRARDLFDQLVPDMTRVLGEDHPTTLMTKARLARAVGQAGDPRSASELLSSLSPETIRVLGSDHPISLATKEELAYWLGQSGDPRGSLLVLAGLVGKSIQSTDAEIDVLRPGTVQ